MRRLLSLLVNLGLSAGVCAALALSLEGLARWRESRHPETQPARELIRGWQQWEGDFYHFGRRPPHWPLDDGGVNGDGLRDVQHTREAPPGTERVAFLGDSVTYGLYVEARQAFPQQLQARLDQRGERLEVFNVAAPGWTTRQQRLAHERLLRPYGLRHVVLAVCLNDLLELRQNLAPPPPWMEALHRRSALFRFVTRAAEREVAGVEELDRRPDGPVGREALAVFAGELALLRDELARDGVALSLLLLPYEYQVRAAAPAPQLQPRLLALAARLALPAQDLLEPLRALGTPAFVDHNHLSPAGHRAVAEALLAGPLLPERRRYGALAGSATLDDPDAERRAAAAWQLGRVGPGPAQAQALAARVADSDGAVRLEALRALARVEARPGLRAAVAPALADGQEAVRLEAARTLWAWGTESGDLPALMGCLAHRDAYLRAFGEESLARLGPSALPLLRRLLAQPDTGLRRRALRLVARMGPLGLPAAAEAAAALDDADPGVRRLAARALGQIGATGARPGLERRARSDPDAQVRAEAARALDLLGGRPPSRD